MAPPHHRRRHSAWLCLTALSVGLIAVGCSEAPGKPEPDAIAQTTGTQSSAVRPSTVAPPRRLVNPQPYASPASRWPQWGFVTPSGRWICVIATAPSGGDSAACAANPDQGPLPTPGLPFATPRDGSVGTLRPNVVVVPENGLPVFEARNEPIWEAGGVPRTLPYGAILTAAGFTCNAQESGVSCRIDSPGAGFSISTVDYRLGYTDVPG